MKSPVAIIVGSLVVIIVSILVALDVNGQIDLRWILLAHARLLLIWVREEFGLHNLLQGKCLITNPYRVPYSDNRYSDCAKVYTPPEQLPQIEASEVQLFEKMIDFDESIIVIDQFHTSKLHETYDTDKMIQMFLTTFHESDVCDFVSNFPPTVAPLEAILAMHSRLKVDEKFNGASALVPSISWTALWSNCAHERTKALRSVLTSPDWLSSSLLCNGKSWVFMEFNTSSAEICSKVFSSRKWIVAIQKSGVSRYVLEPYSTCDNYKNSATNLEINMDSSQVLIVNTGLYDLFYCITSGATAYAYAYGCE